MQVHYVFEDNSASLLSQLFRKAYSPDVVANFHYARGNSKIVAYVTTTFSSEDEVTVFLDMPPGNPNVVRHYIQLADLRKQYSKLLVFPLICSEYYYLQFVRGTHIVAVPQWVDSCLAFNLVSATPSILTAEEETKYTTYENFCKLVARKAIIQCGRIGVLNKGESDKRPFFYADCLCGTHLVSQRCRSWSAVEKSLAFIKQFPVHPAFGVQEGERLATWDERVSIHRKLVNNYNLLSLLMSRKDADRKGRYVSISPMV